VFKGTADALAPILPGQTTTMQNVKTGKWCRWVCAAPLSSRGIILAMHRGWLRCALLADAAAKPLPRGCWDSTSDTLAAPVADPGLAAWPAADGRLSACRLAPLPSGEQGVLCDQDTSATATVLTYTGSGLTYKGDPLVSAGPGKPLVLQSTAASPPPAGASKMSFTVPPTPSELL
jgi:hypothetical protein